MNTAILSPNHAEGAARVVRDRLASLRDPVPCLSATCGDPGTLHARIASLAGRGPGVVAFDRGRMVGFLAAFPIRYGGRASMLSPEWGHGVSPDVPSGDARRIYETLYAAVAGGWASAGAETHLVALLAHDAPGAEALTRLGFGQVVCDAVRPLDPVSVPRGAPAVRRATVDDAEVVCAFDRALHAHLAAPPVFLLVAEDEDETWWAQRLADPTMAAWLAEQDGLPVGYLLQTPASDDACDLTFEAGTSSITGAYVDRAARGCGVATALLARAVEWAREQGYSRMAVDFETANVEGARFWRSHFRPVVVSWGRTIRSISP